MTNESKAKLWREAACGVYLCNRRRKWLKYMLMAIISGGSLWPGGILKEANAAAGVNSAKKAA